MTPSPAAVFRFRDSLAATTAACTPGHDIAYPSSGYIEFPGYLPAAHPAIVVQHDGEIDILVGQFSFASSVQKSAHVLVVARSES